MFFIIYLCFLILFTLLINYFLIKNNVLISETGDIHQKFASKSKVPLTGGIILFLSILFFFNLGILSFILFSFIILILGIFSDLKLIRSAKLRLLLQIIIVLTFIIFNDLRILDTRVHLIDNLLDFQIINYLFVCFCILILMNGSNFFDGLNTLNIGYYLLVYLSIFFLNLNGEITVQDLLINNIFYIILLIYILNFFNKIFLGDSGSYLIGFIFAVFLIDLYAINTQISPFFIILLLWYPCYETLFSIIRKNVLKRSSLDPDSNHLHQLIYFFVKRKIKKDTLIANLLSANFINFYNLLVFLISLNFVTNSQVQILLIILNLIVYTVIYFRLFIFRYKKI